MAVFYVIMIKQIQFFKAVPALSLARIFSHVTSRGLLKTWYYNSWIYLELNYAVLASFVCCLSLHSVHTPFQNKSYTFAITSWSCICSKKMAAHGTTTIFLTFQRNLFGFPVSNSIIVTQSMDAAWSFRDKGNGGQCFVCLFPPQCIMNNRTTLVTHSEIKGCWISKSSFSPFVWRPGALLTKTI